ncbi:DUF1735 domain-containing protein [Terrimonas rubra]|uniref:DUF1735 domain-containing protein n=1 Tax=Terrimonas rubra TaxID=1035890 RepID=A0ABW6A4T1_9BACT
MRKIKLSLALGFAVVTGLTSCLKEDTILSKDESNNVIEIYNNVPGTIVSDVSSLYPLYSEAFDVVPSAPYIFRVSYSGADVAPQDITVTLDQDPAALDYYNEEFDKHFEVLPASKYTIPGWTVTIKKGQRIAEIPVEFKTDQFDLSKSYAIPLKIVSASYGTISKNYGTVIFEIIAKNKYDGAYKGNGYTFMGTSNTTAPFLWSIDCSWGLNLITTGANSVYMDAKPVYRGGSIIYFGGIFPNIVFDPATDKVTAVNASGPGNGYNYGFPAVQTPTYNSRYDAATKTIYISYNIINTTWYATDTLVYCGPR